MFAGHGATTPTVGLLNRWLPAERKRAEKPCGETFDQSIALYPDLIRHVKLRLCPAADIGK